MAALSYTAVHFICEPLWILKIFGVCVQQGGNATFYYPHGDWESFSQQEHVVFVKASHRCFPFCGSFKRRLLLTWKKFSVCSFCTDGIRVEKMSLFQGIRDHSESCNKKRSGETLNSMTTQSLILF